MKCAYRTLARVKVDAALLDLLIKAEENISGREAGPFWGDDGGLRRKRTPNQDKRQNQNGRTITQEKETETGTETETETRETER